MGAVWARTRGGLHVGLRSWVALALMIGIAGGAVMASAAAARRTDSAYRRFRAVTHGFDAMSIGCANDVPWPAVDPGASALPEVAASVPFFYRLGYPSAAGGRTIFADQPNADGGVVGAMSPADAGAIGMKLLAGRMPNPYSANEVTVSYRLSQDPAIKVGDTIFEHLVRPDADLSVLASGTNLPPSLFSDPIPVKIVGIMLISGPINEVRGDAQDVLATPAFLQKYGALGRDCSGRFFRLQNGSADAPGFVAGVQKLTPNAIILTASDETTFVSRSTHLQAVTFGLFAALILVAGMTIFGQALARQTSMGATENPILRALGMTPGQLFGVSMLRSALVGVAAAALAVALAIAASGFVLTGIAKLVEPNPGVSVDAFVVFGGAVVIVLAVMLISVIPAWRAARVSGDQMGASLTEAGKRVSPLALAASKAGAPPSASIGMKLALEPGRGRTAVPVRSAIVGLVLAIVALVAALGYAASFKHLLGTPRLIGVTFETGAGNPYADSMGKTVRPLLANEPGLTNLAGGNFAKLITIKGPEGANIAVNVWGLESIKGTQHPPTNEGRWPVADGEIALGAKTMRQVGANLGDTITVTGEGHSVDLKVVGRAVFPDFGFGPGLGEGAGITFSQLQVLFPGVDEDLYLTDVVPGTNFAEVQARVNPTLIGFGAGGLALGPTGATAGASLDNAKRVRSLPSLLAGVLGLMAVAMLAHTQLSSIRRRRRDLAILKTLGFTKRQVSATVAWQASTLVTVSLVIGVPLGMAIGRWAWTLFAENLGVTSEPVVPFGQILLLIPAAIIFANLIALLPGLSAGRTKPSIVLRSE